MEVVFKKVQAYVQDLFGEYVILRINCASCRSESLNHFCRLIGPQNFIFRAGYKLNACKIKNLCNRYGLKSPLKSRSEDFFTY
jgi:hypothetical protein